MLQKLIYATGKGASVSHAPSLSLGLDKDVFKFSDIMSTWSPRSLAENDKEAEKNKEKEKKSGSNTGMMMAAGAGGLAVGAIGGAIIAHELSKSSRVPYLRWSQKPILPPPILPSPSTFTRSKRFT